MKQINISLTILLTYFPEDLNLDDSTSKEELLNCANTKLNEIIKNIQDSTGLEVNDIEIDMCG